MGLYWDSGKENGNYYLGVRVYSPPEVDRIWGIWGTYFHIAKAILYRLKGHYSVSGRSTGYGWILVEYDIMLELTCYSSKWR